MKELQITIETIETKEVSSLVTSVPTAEMDVYACCSCCCCC